MADDNTPVMDYSEFEKRTIAMLAAIHYKEASSRDSHEWCALADTSLAVVLDGYKIELNKDDPLWGELLLLVYEMNL